MQSERAIWGQIKRKCYVLQDVTRELWARAKISHSWLFKNCFKLLMYPHFRWSIKHLSRNVTECVKGNWRWSKQLLSENLQPPTTSYLINWWGSRNVEEVSRFIQQERAGKLIQQSYQFLQFSVPISLKDLWSPLFLCNVCELACRKFF